MRIITKVEVDLKPTAAEVLDIIDEKLAEDTYESRQLWDVLTALRGPDIDDSHALKEVTTARIRHAAFPKTSASTFDRGIFQAGKVDDDAVHAADYGPAKTTTYAHFCWHIRAAVGALITFGRL